MARDSFTAYNQSKINERVRADQAATNSVPQPSERFKGIGTVMYGGIAALGTEHSMMRSADKYFKDMTGGRSLYDKNRVNNRLFNQLTLVDNETLSQIQPHIKGHCVFVVGEMPRMMEILYPKQTEYMRSLLSSSVIGISGFVDRTMETGTLQGPSEQNSIDFVTKQTGITKRITLTLMSPFRGLQSHKYFTTWMQMIYSPGSTAAVYPYYTELDFHEGNHSMNAIFIVTDPSYQMVEAAQLIYAMVPLTNNAAKILNNTWGDHQIETYDVEFKCHTLPDGMPQTLKIGSAVLYDYNSEVELDDYKVLPISDIDNPDASTMGIKSAIYEGGRNFMNELSNIEKSE